MPPKLRSKSLTSNIFKTIISEADDLLFLFSNPRAVFYTLGDVDAARTMLARKNQKLKHAKKQLIQQAMCRLETQKLIKTRKMGNKIYYFLTDDGIQEGLKLVIQKKKKLLSNDLKCYVSFDIPENVNSVRYALRKLLKNANFKMVHFSLWCTKYDIAKELALLIKLMNAEPWIHVFEARLVSKMKK